MPERGLTEVSTTAPKVHNDLTSVTSVTTCNDLTSVTMQRMERRARARAHQRPTGTHNLWVVVKRAVTRWPPNLPLELTRRPDDGNRRDHRDRRNHRNHRNRCNRRNCRHLPLEIIRRPDDGALGDVAMRGDNLLECARRESVPRAVDHVVRAPHHVDVTVGVNEPGVARRIVAREVLEVGRACVRSVTMAT